MSGSQVQGWAAGSGALRACAKLQQVRNSNFKKKWHWPNVKWSLYAIKKGLSTGHAPQLRHQRRTPA
jgi:hypothetical protein